MTNLNINIINQIIEEVCNFYDVPISSIPNNIEIEIHSKEQNEKRGTIKDNKIIIGQIKDEPFTNLIPVILHEISHFVERKARDQITKHCIDYLKSKNIEITKKETEEVFGEALLRTLLPNGWLAVKYNLRTEEKILKQKKKINNWKENITSEIKAKSLPITKKILANGETLFSKNNIDKYCEVYYKIITNLR